MIPRLVGLAIVLPGVGLAACSDRPPTVCTEELRVQFTPSDTSITTGQSFTASVTVSSCGGALKLIDTFGWRSDDPAIATVDSVSGRVVGQAPGATHIHADGNTYGPVGSLAVSVQTQAEGPVLQTLTVVPTMVRPGDPLRATLTIRNETSDTVRLTSGYGCIAFLDVLSDTTRVPMHGTQFGCTASARRFVIPPQEALVESYDLLAKIQSSEAPYDYVPAPSGVYRLRADVLVLGLADPETQFTVQP